MFRDYVLGSEVAEKGNFHSANISMLISNFNLVEGVDFQKFGGIVLLNRKSLSIPKYIYKIMCDKDITNLKGLIPYPLFENTLEKNLKLISEDYKIINIYNKKFVDIMDKELKDIFNSEKIVKSVVNYSEIEDLLKDKLIKSYRKISNKKALCWY